MTRPIAISLSPNTEKDDVFLAIKTLFNPLKWFDRREVEKLEEEFAQWFGGGYHALAVNSGRSAQYLILKGLGIGKGDEVAIQAFTCVAVPNSVLWTGAKPVYVDIDSTYNMDSEDLAGKITPKTRAVIVQNTFGISFDWTKISRVLSGKEIFLIEDCAHALGAYYFDAPVGSLGEVSFFSFGRDKLLSSVFGGMILVDAAGKELFGRLKRLRDKLPAASAWWTVQQLFHPIAFWLILPVYSIGVGKLLLLLLQKIGLLSRAVCQQERKGRRPGVFPAKVPPALAVLARHQFKKVGKFNNHRKKIAQFYATALASERVIFPITTPGDVWLRFPIQVESAPELIKFAKKKGILLGDWYRQLVAPCDDPSVVGYRWGSCPKAEDAARKIVNLPTYPTLSQSDAKKVVQAIKQWLATQ